MKSYFKIITSIIKKYKTTFMYSNMLIFIMFIGFSINTFLVYNTNKELSEDTLNSLMTYDSYMDMDKYCNAAGCKYIYKTVAGSGSLIGIENYEVTKGKIPPKYIINNYELYLPLDISGTYFYIPVLSKNIENILFNIAGLIFMFVLVILIINSILVTERKSYLSSINNKEEFLRKDIITNIALNINHELNSPLIVIKSLLDDMKYILDQDINMNNNCISSCFNNTYACLEELKEDILDAETALDNVYGVVRPMGDFKSIENSNGNKNIYMLLNSSINIVKISNDYSITKLTVDDELKKYSIYHNDGFTNGAFSNIVINHIKNSIDAHSTNLEFKLSNKDDKYLYIDIIDNGDGIPDYIKNKIFNINITTKADVSKYERGVGMYINKMILEKYRGTDKLKHTQVGVGTTFTIKVMYEKFKLYDKIYNF